MVALIYLGFFGGVGVLTFFFFYGAKSNVLLSRLNPRQPASVKYLVAGEPAWQPATLPYLANLENANVWKEAYEQAKDPGKRGSAGGEGNR